MLARYGGAAPWWRVIHADGTPAPGHDASALAHYLAEGTPLRSAPPPVRVDMRRARWRGDGSASLRARRRLKALECRWPVVESILMNGYRLVRRAPAADPARPAGP